MSQYVRCSKCGQIVSQAFPGDIIVRAYVECPECVEKRDQFELIGEVVFVRSEEDSKCICCGEPAIPHKHIFGYRIDFPEGKTLYDYEQEFIFDRRSKIESKKVRIIFEVMNET